MLKKKTPPLPSPVVEAPAAVEPRRVHLPVISIRHRTIWCPYQAQSIVTELCFVNQRNATHAFCYRCPDGAELERKLGARTYDRVVDFSLNPAPKRPYVMVRVPASLKRDGVEFTYVKVYLEEGRIEKPFHETWDIRIPYLGSNEKIHFPRFSKAEEDALAAEADKERKRMVRGGRSSVGKGTKKMISPEMQKLIAERKAKDANGGWYRKMQISPEEQARNKTLIKMGENASGSGHVVVPKPAFTPSPVVRPFKPKPKRSWNVFGGLKKKPEEPKLASTSDLISKEAKRLSFGLRKKPKL